MKNWEVKPCKTNGCRFLDERDFNSILKNATLLRFTKKLQRRKTLHRCTALILELKKRGLWESLQK